MSANRQVIMNAEDIGLALQRIALQILENNHNADSIAVVGIHTCGVFLADRIVEIIQKNSSIGVDSGSLDITLYRDDWSLITQSPVVRTTDIAFGVEGKSLILIDDVIYTGRTIRAALDAIMDYGRPDSIQLGCLVDRGGRELPIQPDYTGLVTSVRANERIRVLMNEQAAVDEVVIES
ncbi:MAG: bifunctional pyr operon transcriptional regulator/uracil phosphoribosyltransferase PyrR [Desulfocapsaceae bacterium]|nr:bifunctional pyr operon transcriptional regulator/uracil phosphoribosyltransferase PyrR [Desulfocapsaceae bacterium]